MRFGIHSRPEVKIRVDKWIQRWENERKTAACYRDGGGGRGCCRARARARAGAWGGGDAWRQAASRVGSGLGGVGKLERLAAGDKE